MEKLETQLFARLKRGVASTGPQVGIAERNTNLEEQ
jgi:hypothetical protein